MPPPSPVSREVVRKIAALARVSLPDEELPAWTEQLGRIVSYIDQLKELPLETAQAGEAPVTPLRADTPTPGEGREALEGNSRLLHGYGVVPRVVSSS